MIADNSSIEYNYGEWKMTLNGCHIGYAPNYAEAATIVNQTAYEWAMLALDVPPPNDDWEFAAAEDAEPSDDQLDDERAFDDALEDDWADAAWESAQGSYNGKVPSDFIAPLDVEFTMEPWT